LHAQGKKVAGVEVRRDVYIYSNRDDIEVSAVANAAVFGRDVDILVKDGTKEEWYEVKSWKSRDGTDQLGGGITPWKWGSGVRDNPGENEFASAKLAGKAAHKQFTLDQIAMKLGARKRHADDNDPKIEVKEFYWLFHQFKVKRKSPKPAATNPSIMNIKKGFNNPPSQAKLLSAHTGTSNAQPVGKITLGFLNQFLDEVESELEDAIREEMTELGNE
jgi:hypothetical protein